jgi:hypothetical protein
MRGLLRRLACILLWHGHDMLISRQPRRIALRCVTCGYQTTGWEIGQ